MGEGTQPQITAHSPSQGESIHYPLHYCNPAAATDTPILLLPGRRGVDASAPCTRICFLDLHGARVPSPPPPPPPPPPVLHPMSPC
ncbi:hypothetical protein FKM82_029524, partial [Ascaphus truei]